MKLKTYLDLRRRLADLGYRDEYDWAQTVKAPENADAFAAEYVWVVLNSGMKYRVAEKIAERVWDAFAAGNRAQDVFGHKAKAEAIDAFWKNRDARFEEFQGETDVVAFCRSLPWIGPITCWHLAKNWGQDVAKPDRWLVRVAEAAGETVDGLCRRLSRESGDRVATVDLIIWRGCELGVLKPGSAKLLDL